MKPILFFSFAQIGQVRPDYSCKARRVGSRLALVFIGLTLNACNGIYLHSNADQKALDTAFAGLQTVKKAELEILAKHKLDLKRLIEQQRSVVVKEQIALRDEWLANAIDAKDWQSDIQEAATAQFDYLINGKTMVAALSNAKTPVNVHNFIRQGRLHQSQLNATQRQLAKAVSKFKAKGGVLKKSCGLSGEAPIAENLGGAAAEFTDLDKICTQFKNQLDKSFGNYAPMAKQPVPVRCISGDLPVCESETGLVYDAFASLFRADELLSTNKKLRAAVQQQLRALEAGYRCTLDKADTAGADEAARIAKQRIQQFVDALPDTAAELQRALETPSAKKPIPSENCAAAATEELGFVDLLATTGHDPSTFNSLIRSLEVLGVASGGSVAATVSAGKADYEVERLSMLANAVAVEKETKVDKVLDAASKLGLDSRAASDALAAGGTLQNPIADGEPSPDPKVVLIDLAVARYRQSLAGIELQRLQQARELLQVRTDALLNQLSGLDKALTIANHNHREEAIVALAQSWNSGAIPAAATGVELRGQQYLNAAELDEATVTARYQTLEPLLAELQAYGAGGFTAEDIARFLSAAALVGVAVGAN